MQRTALALLVALPLGPCLAAQDLASGGGGQDPQAEFTALAKEFNDARAAFGQKQQAAYEKGGDDALKALADQDPLKVFLPRFQEGAKKHAPTPYAVPYLTWLLTTSRDQDIAKDSLATLVKAHADSPELEGVCNFLSSYGWQMVGKSAARDALKAMRESPHTAVRGSAVYAGAMMTLNNRQVSEVAREDALADVRKALEMAPTAKFAPRAEGMIFEQEHLQVGKAAPDIEGEDLDGVAFKLSDYKGKVVMLDFWGNW